MSYVINEWVPIDATQTVLRITGVYTVDVVVSPDDVKSLSMYSWCYEQIKGNVYMTDRVGELSKLLRISSPRVYLWKLIPYLRTGSIVTAWKRDNPLDYRWPQGVLVKTESIVV